MIIAASLGFGIVSAFAGNASVALCDGLTKDSNPQTIQVCADQCAKQGGQWGGVEQGRGRIPGCNAATKDGGKSCEASDQCEGACLESFAGNKPVHQCSQYKQNKGCHILMRTKDGIQNMCID